MNLSGKRILVVEDEPIVAMMVEDMLMEMGAAVVGPAATVREAMELVQGEAVLDGALLDLNLNGERSHAVATALRERGVPVIYATGYGIAGPEDPNGALVLQKPYTEDQIAAILAKALDGKG